ncbi:hypothetical protein KC19_10G167800 [Ceratodon purpureus]|uniref:Uncharacterized protein n=1 Tax=Ceratodon purpureus TaxID=3225 RepID=A0A8T0GNW2_CERPU|nr:hypothetical protein KC19_10G167800 [Ceratodon purpureus]
MARGGCCWSGPFCLGSLSRKNKKRIAPAIGISQSSDPQGQFAFLLAPPSSPASYENSMVPSSAQSPYYPPTCPVPSGGGSRIPLETQSNMFTVGPYAHETALVSPPVFSTFTTAPSTAPFTPPPELAAQFTRPSSPDVPFAKLLASSFTEQRLSVSGKREPEPPYSASPFASPDYYQQDQNQQDDLQVAYQLYPGSPLGRMISPAGTTGASTPFGGGGTTGTTTPHPDSENPTPLTVLPAVVSILPNLEHQVAERLHQRSILDSQCGPGEPLSDSYRERNGSFDGNSRFMGAILHERDGYDSNSNSYGHERYSGSLSGLNEVLEGQSRYPKLKQGKSPRRTTLESQEELEDDIREDDLLELPMLSGTDRSPCDSRPSRSPSNSRRYQSRVGSKTGSLVGSKAGSKAGSKVGSKTGSDALKEWDHNEENLLEYALSLLEGTNGNRQGTIGWAPLDTSLSRESEASAQSFSGLENWTEESRANSLRVDSSRMPVGDQIGNCSTGVPQETKTAGESEAPEDASSPVEHRDRDPGCCSRCEALVSQCEQLSVALKEAERKQLEKERLAEEREQQIRHLTQLLQSGGLKKFVGNFSRSGNQAGKDN